MHLLTKDQKQDFITFIKIADVKNYYQMIESLFIKPYEFIFLTLTIKIMNINHQINDCSFTTKIIAKRSGGYFLKVIYCFLLGYFDNIIQLYTFIVWCNISILYTT